MKVLMHKLKNLLENLPLSQKFITSYIIIILVPIIIFSYVIFNSLKDKYLEDTIRKNIYMLGIEKTKVINNINEMEAISQKVSSSKTLMDYIKKKGSTSVSDLIDLNFNTIPDIKNLQFSNPTIEDLKIYSNNPSTTELGLLILKQSRIENIPAYKKILNFDGDECWNINFSIKSDENNIATYYKKDKDYISINKNIYSYSKEKLGFIEVDMLSENFFPAMYKDAEDNQSEIILLGKGGHIYYNGKNALKQKLNIDDEDIKKSFLNKRISEEGRVNLKNNNQVVMVYNYIPKLECYMIDIVSMSDTFKTITHKRDIILSITVGLIILLIIVTKLTNSLILKKLHIMINTVASIEKGNFDVTLEVRGNDELGKLAHQFRKLISKINQLIAEEVNKKESTREVELRALQTQIDSHFLYNTLENIKMIAEIEEQYVISDSITALGEMMKYNMSWKREYVSLEEEVNHIKNYISLMNIRYNNKIKLLIDLNEDLLRVEVLKLILQPMVENSVKYAIKSNAAEELQLTIAGFIEQKSVIIDVIDNGIGITEEQVSMLNNVMSGNSQIDGEALYENKKGNGIGLKNVNERIKLFYGDNYGIKVFSKLNEYTKIRVCLPNTSIIGG